jgi:hypothetical protein
MLINVQKDVLDILYEEKGKIVKYIMLLKHIQKQEITSTADAYMDVINDYRQKIQAAKEMVAYLERVAYLDIGLYW